MTGLLVGALLAAAPAVAAPRGDGGALRGHSGGAVHRPLHAPPRPPHAPHRPLLGHRPGGTLPPAAGFNPPHYRPPAGFWHGDRWARTPLAQPFHWPRGYRYHRYHAGLFLPAALAGSVFHDWRRVGLYPPPPRTHWTRVGPDLLLVDANSSRIAAARYGVFR